MVWEGQSNRAFGRISITSVSHRMFVSKGVGHGDHFQDRGFDFGYAMQARPFNRPRQNSNEIFEFLWQGLGAVQVRRMRTPTRSYQYSRTYKAGEGLLGCPATAKEYWLRVALRSGDHGSRH